MENMRQTTIFCLLVFVFLVLWFVDVFYASRVSSLREPLNYLSDFDTSQINFVARLNCIEFFSPIN